MTDCSELAMRASGSPLGRTREAHEQLALRSPTALLVWQHISAAWLRFAGGQWAVTAANGQPDLAMRREPSRHARLAALDRPHSR